MFLRGSTSTDNLPFYAYYLSQIATLCGEVLDISNPFSPSDIIRSNELNIVANTGAFCDLRNITNIQIIFTEGVWNHVRVLEIVKSKLELLENYEKNDDLFTPTLIFASVSEAGRFAALFKPLTESLAYVGFVFLFAKNQNIQLSEELFLKTVPSTVFNEEVSISNIDKDILSEMVFQVASRMLTALQQYGELLSETEDKQKGT